ncbi:MAG: M28 family peptidase [Spirochaetes bacterium]|nr:M28 family peptidase [Spirochaetota bacterium]
MEKSPDFRKLTDRCLELTAALGIPIRPFRMVFGGGATDAAESWRAGIPSTTIIALPTTVARKGMVYHTKKDTVDHIEPEVVTACLRIVWEYILSIDRG